MIMSYKIIGKVGIADATGPLPAKGDIVVIPGERGPARFRVFEVQHFMHNTPLQGSYEYGHSEVHVELID